MSAALRAVHGVDTRFMRTQIVTAGRTDGESARDPARRRRLRGADRHSRRQRARELLPVMLRLLPEDLLVRASRVRELLNWLAEQEDVKLGLLTGNYEPIARLKLSRAGIGWAFPLGRELSARTPRIAQPCRRSPGDVRTGQSRCLMGDDRDRRHAAGHRVCAGRRVQCVAVATDPSRGTRWRVPTRGAQRRRAAVDPAELGIGSSGSGVSHRDRRLSPRVNAPYHLTAQPRRDARPQRAQHCRSDP